MAVGPRLKPAATDYKLHLYKNYKECFFYLKKHFLLVHELHKIVLFSELKTRLPEASGYFKSCIELGSGAGP